jgi:NADPH-dependent curcumin reductase CurA
VPWEPHRSRRSSSTGRDIRLAARPTGTPALEQFELVEADVPEPRAGEILVRNTWLSVDPYMRAR